ncbi:cytochrome P450 [Streptomyces collinus]|uniref:cytochrome P450 n=1 Tax=Streptomyces collinus TaxID=42684 RepID=UPI0036BC6292
MTQPAEIVNPVRVAPRSLPVAGHLLHLLSPRRLDFLRSLRATGPVVRIRLGTRDAYVLTTHEASRQLLQVQAGKFSRGSIFEKSRPIIGNGILSSDGEIHIRQRRNMQPVFHQQCIGRYVEPITKVTSRHVRAWRNGQTVSVGPEMHRMAGTILSHTIFSAERVRELATIIEDNLPTLYEGMTWRIFGPGEALKRIPTPGNRRFQKANESIRRTTDLVIREYRNTPTGPSGDLVSMLIDAPDPYTGGPMSDQELCDEIVTIFVAGVDTPATMLSWALHELSTRESLARRLEGEVDRVLEGRTLTYNDIPQMPLLAAFINELLRLYTPNTLLMRSAKESVTIEGFSIPQNAEVMYSPAALHWDEEIFPDPTQFKPERWLDAEASTIPRSAFIPFGAGNRRCIGDNLAIVEMHTVLSTLIARWRFEPVAPKRVRPIAGVLVHPPKSLAVRLAARHTSSA